MAIHFAFTYYKYRANKYFSANIFFIPNDIKLLNVIVYWYRVMKPRSPEWVVLSQTDATLSNSLQKTHVLEKGFCQAGELMYV